MVWNKVLWSTLKVDFPTPQYVFDLLDHEFHFDLDAAATADNTKCTRFISPEQNALTMADWPGKSIFLNPRTARGWANGSAKRTRNHRRARPLCASCQRGLTLAGFTSIVFMRISSSRITAYRLTARTRPRSRAWLWCLERHNHILL